MPIGTRRHSCRLRDLKRQLLILFVCSVATLAVSACGLNSDDNVGPNPGQRQSSVADPRTLATSASQDGRFSIDPPASLHETAAEAARKKGPFANIKPLEIRQGGSLGSLGLNLDTMFVDDLKDPHARIERLESAVLAMQADMKTLAPSMQRMAVIEQDLEALVGQLEAVLQEEQGGATPSYTAATTTPAPSSAPLSLHDMGAEEDEAPAPQTTQQPAPTTPPAAAPTVSSGLNVLDLRLGEHPGKTRLVFDVTGKVDFRTDLDNAEKILVVEIDKAAWGSNAGKTLSSPLVQSYSTQKLESGGVRVILVLKKNATLSSKSLLPPQSGNTHHRIVIDLSHG